MAEQEQSRNRYRHARRWFARREGTLHATLHAGDASSTSHEGVVVLDISASGAMLRTPIALRPGERWSLAISCHDNTVRNVHVLVRWAVENADAYEAGVQFTADPAVLTGLGITPAELAPQEGSLREANAPVWNRKVGIHAHKPLQVQSLCGTRVRCDSDLQIDREANDCEIDVGGRVIAPTAHVTGGSMTILGEAEIGELGDAEGHRTILTLGASRVETALQAEVRTAIATARVKLEASKQQAAALKDRTLSDLSAADREAIMVNQFDYQHLSERLERLERQSVALAERENRLRLVRLTVQQMIHPGVELRANDQVIVFTTPARGPLVISQNAAGDLQVESSPPSHPLTALASVATLSRSAA